MGLEVFWLGLRLWFYFYCYWLLVFCFFMVSLVFIQFEVYVLFLFLCYRFCIYSGCVLNLKLGFGVVWFFWLRFQVVVFCEVVVFQIQQFIFVFIFIFGVGVGVGVELFVFFGQMGLLFMKRIVLRFSVGLLFLFVCFEDCCCLGMWRLFLICYFGCLGCFYWLIFLGGGVWFGSGVRIMCFL